MTATRFTDYVYDKAQAIVDAGTIQPTGNPNMFYVPTAADSHVYYRVEVGHPAPTVDWASCTCPYGQRRTRPGQSLCSHATAALLHVLRADASEERH